MFVADGPDVRILGAQTLEEGSDIVLLCSPDSVPPAIVTWTVKGMSAGNESLYVAENSKPSDSGDYVCTCFNNVTEITAFAVQVVSVRGRCVFYIYIYIISTPYSNTNNKAALFKHLSTSI